MSSDPGKLARRLKHVYTRRMRRALAASAPVPGAAPDPPFESYRNDPSGFIRDVLGLQLTPDQERIAGQIAYGGRVKVNAGHNVGKTLLAACLALWWFYTRPKSVVITTAPTERDVVDL